MIQDPHLRESVICNVSSSGATSLSHCAHRGVHLIVCSENYLLFPEFTGPLLLTKKIKQRVEVTVVVDDEETMPIFLY